MLARGWQGLAPQNRAVPGPVCCQPGNGAPDPSAHPTQCRERSKKKKKKQEKLVKGKGDKKGTTSKSSSSKSPAKGMSDSFKSKEFVSSDESSSAESKKEVGVTAGGGPGPSFLGNNCLGRSQLLFLGEHPGGFCWSSWVLLVPHVCGTWTSLEVFPSHHRHAVPTVVGDTACLHCPLLTSLSLPAGLRGRGSCQPTPQLRGLCIWLRLAPSQLAPGWIPS